MTSLLCLTACAASPPIGENLLQVPVDSWALVDVAPLNSRIEAAVAAGATWPRSPLLTTMELLGGEAETQGLALTLGPFRGEVPDTAVIIMARDGFLDDSIRGDWHRLLLLRSRDGSWRIDEIRRAFRCWRAHSLDRYAARRCL
jgi:hypothetical protein